MEMVMVMDDDGDSHNDVLESLSNIHPKITGHHSESIELPWRIQRSTSPLAIS